MADIIEILKLILESKGASPEQVSEYRIFLENPESLPADKRAELNSKLSDLVEQVMQKNPEFAKSINNIMSKSRHEKNSIGLPDLDIEPASYAELVDHGRCFDKTCNILNKEKKVLASIGDIYTFATTLQIWLEKGDHIKFSEANNQIHAFKKVMYPERVRLGQSIATSTKILYRKERSEIIDYFCCEAATSVIRQGPLPELRDIVKLQDFLKSPIDLKFFQVLLNTKDNPDTIFKKWEILLETANITIALPLENSHVREANVSVEIYEGSNNARISMLYMDGSQAYILRKNPN